MRKIITYLAGISALFVAGCSKEANTSSQQFRAGQVWTFTPPTGQPNAKLTILRIETASKIGSIVHVAISDVSYGKGGTSISHLPFTEDAVRKSVTKLISESASMPDYTEGYKIWKEAFDSGKGGVFTISVGEAVDAVTGIAQQSPSSAPAA